MIAVTSFARQVSFFTTHHIQRLASAIGSYAAVVDIAMGVSAG